MQSIKYIFITILMAVAQLCLAQETSLPNEQVDVIKDFEATLAESEKVNVSPILPDLDTTARKLTYKITEKTADIEYAPPKIRPLAVKRDEVPKSYLGYVKLGYGSPYRPYAELAYHNAKDKAYDIGGHLKYHTAKSKKIEHQAFKDIGGGINGNYYFDQGYAVSGGLGYQFDELHFYGYDHDTSLNIVADDIKQQFQTFSANARVFNGERNMGDINYTAGFDLYTLADNYAARELGFDIELGATKWINETHAVDVWIDADFTRFKSLESRSLNNFGLRPSYTHHGDKFKVKLGANITSYKANFKLFPDIEANVQIIGTQLAAYIGANGGLHKNSFKNLSDYNPFIVSNAAISNTTFYKFFGGVKGNYKTIDYQVQAGYKIANNMAFFVNDAIDTTRFIAVYDSARVFNLEGTLEAHPRKDLRVLATMTQNFFSLSNFDAPWHIPSVNVNIGAFYTTFRDQLILKGELYVENGVKFRSLSDGSEQRLKGLFDFNLGANFKFNKNINIFLDLNNILNNKRQRWNGYQNYGFNVLGGVVARF